MFALGTIRNKIFIFFAEKYIDFNTLRNSNAHQDFINLVDQPSITYNKTEYPLIDDLPESIGFHRDHYIDINTSEVLELIYNDMEKLESILGYSDWTDKIYLRTDIKEIDPEILDDFKKFNFIVSLTDNSAFGIWKDVTSVTSIPPIHAIQKWLINKLKLDNVEMLNENICQRFNLTEEQFSGISNSDYCDCLLIYFCENLKACGHKVNISYIFESLLHVDQQLIETESDVECID